MCNHSVRPFLPCWAPLWRQLEKDARLGCWRPCKKQTPELAAASRRIAAPLGERCIGTSARGSYVQLKSCPAVQEQCSGNSRAIRGTCRSRPHREKLRQTPLSRTAWAVFAQDNLASGWGPCRISKGRCISSRAFDKLSGKSGLRASTSRCCLETKDGRAAGALRPRHRYHLTVGNLNFVGGLWLDGRCLRTADTRRARRSIAAIDERSFPVFHVFRTSYRGLVLVPGGLACHQRCRTHTFSIVFTKLHASTGTHAERMSRTNPGAKQESCSQK